MIYSITGLLRSKNQNFIVVEAQGVGYKIYFPKALLEQLPPLGQTVLVFCHTHVREDAFDLYGFLTDQQLSLFESLISVSGVGPKSALSIMAVADIHELIAAINEGRVDLLTKAAGVGKKVAERVTLELKGKLSFADSTVTLGAMQSNLDLEETLVSLGFSKAQARSTISKIPPDIKDFNERLKAALKDKK